MVGGGVLVNVQVIAIVRTGSFASVRGRTLRLAWSARYEQDEIVQIVNC
jgi:hypothetical protein